MNLKITIFITVVIILSSCDPKVTFSRKISNQSDSTLILVRYTSTSDTTVIEKGSEIEFAVESHIGRRSEKEDCKNRFPLDSMKLFVLGDTTKTVEVELTGSTGWEFRTEDKTMNGGGICNCYRSITNSDIK